MTSTTPMPASPITAGAVRIYYNTATDTYKELLPDDGWHHGDERAHNAGLSPRDAALDMQRQMIRDAGIKAGDLVLDFGSGIGGPAINMAELSGARFVGVCNNARLTEEARAFAARRGLTEQVCFHEIGDEEYRNFSAWPDGAFDAITYEESVVHLPDKAAFFRAAYRVLRPGGRLAAVDWIKRPWGEHQTPEQIDAVMAPVESTICIPWHATVSDYREMLEAAGFGEVEVTDLFPSGPCWGSTPDDDREAWHERDAPAKIALDNARGEGVFSVAKLVAARP